MHLDIRVGEHFLDESAIQAKDKVDEVNVRLEHLIEQIYHVTREQDYERVCMSPNGNVKILSIGLLIYKVVWGLLSNCSGILN